MNFKITVKNGSQQLSEWLAGKIVEDVKEKYGIEIKVVTENQGPAPKEVIKVEQVEQEQVGSKSRAIKTEYDKYPDILEPRHVQEILGIGRRRVYEFLNDPPFHVVRVGRLIKVSKAEFIRWLEGKS